MTANSFDRSVGVSRRSALILPLGLGMAAIVSRGALSQQPARGGVLRVVAYANPSSLDQSTGRSGADHAFLWPIFDTLVDVEPTTLDPVPGLAESWNYPNSTTLVLNLRTGVVFHDGMPFDAAAVKANFDHMLSSTDVRVRRVNGRSPRRRGDHSALATARPSATHCVGFPIAIRGRLTRLLDYELRGGQ
jgi:ABC-type transport system substrate-binding protein